MIRKHVMHVKKKEKKIVHYINILYYSPTRGDAYIHYIFLPFLRNIIYIYVHRYPE